MSERLIHELKRKYPGLAKRAERGAIPAIRLFCLECMGGSYKEVTECTAPICALYPFRFGRRPRAGDGLEPEETEEAP